MLSQLSGIGPRSSCSCVQRRAVDAARRRNAGSWAAVAQGAAQSLVCANVILRELTTSNAVQTRCGAETDTGGGVGKVPVLFWGRGVPLQARKFFSRRPPTAAARLPSGGQGTG